MAPLPFRCRSLFPIAACCAGSVRSVRSLEMEFTPTFEISTQAGRHLMLVMRQRNDALKILRLHLFTEYFLNEMLIAYLRTDQERLEKVRLRYDQKVRLLEFSSILDKNAVDPLRQINKLRQNVAHRLEYKVSRL